MPFFIPLLLFAGPIIADFIFQAYFEGEREKKQQALLQEGYSPREVATTDDLSSDDLSEFFEEEEAGEVELAGPDWVRARLFG